LKFHKPIFPFGRKFPSKWKRCVQGTRQVQIAVTRSLPFRNTDLVDKAEEWIVLHDAVRNQVWHRFIFAAWVTELDSYPLDRRFIHWIPLDRTYPPFVQPAPGSWFWLGIISLGIYSKEHCNIITVVWLFKREPWMCR
jgi:hypothetical protein